MNRSRSFRLTGMFIILFTLHFLISRKDQKSWGQNRLFCNFINKNPLIKFYAQGTSARALQILYIESYKKNPYDRMHLANFVHIIRLWFPDQNIFNYFISFIFVSARQSSIGSENKHLDGIREYGSTFNLSHFVSSKKFFRLFDRFLFIN